MLIKYLFTRILRINIAKILEFTLEEDAICDISIYGYTEIDNSIVKIELYRNTSFKYSKKICFLVSDQVYNKSFNKFIAIPAFKSIEERKNQSAVNSYLEHSFQYSEKKFKNMDKVRLEFEFRHKNYFLSKILNQVIKKKTFGRASEKDFTFIILFKLHRFLFASGKFLIQHHLDFFNRIQDLEKKSKKLEVQKEAALGQKMDTEFTTEKNNDQVYLKMDNKYPKKDEDTIDKKTETEITIEKDNHQVSSSKEETLEYTIDDINEELENISSESETFEDDPLEKYKSFKLFPILKKFLAHINNYVGPGISNNLNNDQKYSRILKPEFAFGVLYRDFHDFFIEELIDKKTYDKLITLKNPKIEKKQEIYKILSELNKIYEI